MLLDDLIRDEKTINRSLYASGSYWNYKNSSAVLEIKKNGLGNFRGNSDGIGISFADNLVLDVRNYYNIKGKIIGKIFSLPILNVIFNGQLNLTRKYINSLIKNQAVIYQNNKNVENLINKYQFKNTTEFGCIQIFEKLGIKYSTKYLQIADRIDKLSKSFNFGNINSFFEIGGGFGANIHFLITNFPNIKKIIYLDIVPNIYVGTKYLEHHFGKKVKNYLELKNLDKISFQKNDELEIICIPPWLIEKVDVEIDHFHNAASFVEMPKMVIDNYVKFIKYFKTKEISLISYNDYDPKTTFDPQELNLFFKNKIKISLKDDCIEEYNQKFLFLTSN